MMVYATSWAGMAGTVRLASLRGEEDFAKATHTPAAKNTFLQVADDNLVAQALAGGHTVVTHERPENSVHRVKIPNDCIGVEVRHTRPYDMLGRLHARFVLEGE
jgi:hypothetical protein